MKKTLFLSAILGAALCGSAFASPMTTDTSVVNGTTYNGGVYTLSGTGNISGVTITADVTSKSGAIEAGSETAWNTFASNQGNEYTHGHTLHLTQSGTFTSNFSPFTFGGLIVDTGLDSVTVGRSGNTSVEITGPQAVNMDIKSDTTIVGNWGINVSKGGTWNVAEGKSLALSSTGAVAIGADASIALAGGTLNINAANVNLGKGANLQLGSGSTLVLRGTVNALSDNVTETLPTESNGYSSLLGSVDIISGDGTVNADNVTAWQVNGNAATYDNGTLNLSGESTKYYVIQSAELSTALDSKTTDVTIQNGATLNITSHTTRQDGMIKGNVVVKEGSTLKLSANDALGWSGGNHVSTLTVESGAEVNMNNAGNETFGGTLNLNGSLTGIEGSKWDMFSNSTLNVGADAQAEISVGELRLRRNDVTISMGNNSTLDLSAAIKRPYANESNGVLTVTGNGTLNLTGGADIDTLTIRKGGDTNISGKDVTVSKYYVGGGTTNLSATMNAGQVRLDENGTGTLKIKEGGVLNVTGTSNDHSTNASLILNHWGHTGTMVLDGGTLNATGAEMHLSWDGTGIFQANAGTANLLGISAWSHSGIKGTFELGTATEGSAKVIIGANGLSDFANGSTLKLGNGTLGASDDWTLRYNTDLTQTKAQFIATTETGTIIDTTKVGTEGEGATITFKNGTTGVGNMTVQGTGSLVLEGASDRTGTTTINSGTLQVKEGTALGTGSVVLNDGSLQVDTDATIATLTQNGGTIVVAEGSTLTVTTLSIAETATLAVQGAIEFTAPQNITHDSITLDGTTITLGEDHSGVLTTSALTVNSDSTVNANLVIAAGGSITFTEGTVTLGCTIDFGTGTTIALGEAYHDQLKTDGMALIFTGVDDVHGLENVVVTGDFVPGSLVKVQQQDGSFNIYATPEPATATLSLLALAGLMARRRRH